MKIDRRLLIAGLAIAVAMCAAVSTSSASAAVWKDKGVNVTKLISIGLTGGEVFELDWETKNAPGASANSPNANSLPLKRKAFPGPWTSTPRI